MFEQAYGGQGVECVGLYMLGPRSDTSWGCGLLGIGVLLFMWALISSSIAPARRARSVAVVAFAIWCLYCLWACTWADGFWAVVIGAIAATAREKSIVFRLNFIIHEGYTGHNF